MSVRDATWSYVLPSEDGTYTNAIAPDVEENTQMVENDTPLRLSDDIEWSYGLDPSCKDQLAFTHQSIRTSFVRKVFGIIAIMILIVTLECVISLSVKDFSEWMKSKSGMTTLACSGGLFILFFIALALFEDLRRTFPLNVIVAFILASSLGYILALLCTIYLIESILLYLVLLTQTCVALSLLACKPNFNIRRSRGLSLFLSSYLLLTAISSTIYLNLWPDSRWYNVYYAFLGCTLTMIYLLIDIQSIMDGGRMAISPEEYIFGAVQIFVDVIYIFVYLVKLFARPKEETDD